MANVFISYGREDRDKAEALDVALSHCGHVVWWDKSLRAGERFKARIEAQIAAADAVVVVWTETSVKKPWVRAEAILGLSDEKLLPVRFGPNSVPDKTLHSLHADNLTDWDLSRKGPQIDRLNERIARLKSERDKAQWGVMLKPLAKNKAALDLAVDTALPGGLRISRLLLGATLTSAALWIALYAIHSALEGSDGVDLLTFGRIFIALIAARACNQLMIASRGQYIDRFFDSSFSFLCLASLLLGILFSIGTRFFWELSLVQMIDQAMSASLILLVGIYGARAFGLAYLALHRRVE